MENHCGKCGFENSEHDSCRAILKSGKPCTEFMVFKHAQDCPMLGCYGDCEITIAYFNARREEEDQRCQPFPFSLK